MTKPSPTRYRETEAGVRLRKTLGHAVRDPHTPLKMTATLKRRALKKKPGKPEFSQRVIE
jgi:hypothetical protein